MGRFLSCLSWPLFIPAVALLGMLLHAPTLMSGLFADDYLQWALISGHLKHPHYPGSLFGLFNLVDGQHDTVQGMKDGGRLLWSAADHLRVTFWRPLAELTHWLDYAWWPDSPALMHLHNLAWYGALLLALGQLYRRLMPTAAQGNLALLIYAVSSLHVLAIAWLSARNQVMSAFFTVLTVTCYHDWRVGHERVKGLLAALAMVLGLACAEATVAVMAYLVAHAVVIEQDRPWRERVMALLPFLVIVAVWRVTCTHIGYGSVGSGSYVDPVRDPWRFAEMLFVRVPAYLAAMLYSTPSNYAMRMPYEGQAVFAAAALVACLLPVWVARRVGLVASRPMWFLALGALLALVPACAIAPQNRVLIHAEIGMSGVISLLCMAVLARLQQDRASVPGLAKFTVGGMLVLHLMVAPLTTLGGAALMKPLTQTTVEVARAMQPEAADPDAQVVIINLPAPEYVFYIPLVRSYLGLANPKSIWSLANGQQQALKMDVIDEATIRLSSPTVFADILHRDIRSLPFKPGDEVKLDGMTVTVEQVTPEGGPLAARFHFGAPLSDRRWLFYVWENNGLRRFAMPGPGDAVALPAANLIELVKKETYAMVRRQISAQ
jgi:hypothetical protein